MSAHLNDFGWRPTIVTVDSRFYEEHCDPALMQLLPSNVDIARVAAWPSSISRKLRIGDISLRAHGTLRRRVGELIKELRPAIVFVTVLPGYSAFVGTWAKRRFGVRFILDYQDPWVNQRPSIRTQSIKSWLACRAAAWLEPKVLPHVDAITTVSEATLESLRARNLITSRLPVEVIPIGADKQDHAIARRSGHTLIDTSTNEFQIAYLGTVTHKMLPALKACLQAFRNAQFRTSRRLRFHLVGTFEPDVQSLVAELGLSNQVRVHPQRISYLDALRTMQDADLLILLGSTDSHYTASKLFPYWLSKKPILGLFHEASTIVSLANELGGVALVLFGERAPPDACVDALASTLARLVKGEIVTPERREEAFEPYSSVGVARRYAAFFDRAIHNKTQTADIA